MTPAAEPALETSSPIEATAVSLTPSIDAPAAKPD
jgi:hypothetical protein